MTHPLENLERFVTEHVREPWISHGDPIVLYRSAQERFLITHETNSGHESLWRTEQLGDAGIYDAQVDATEFARKFLAEVGDYLSPYDLLHILKHLQEYIDRWNQSRVALNVPTLTVKDI